MSLKQLAAASIMLAISTAPAHAQWSLNGNKIYYTAGKVGIGTSNPNSPLQVVSNIGLDTRPTVLVKNTNLAPEPHNAVIQAVHRSETPNGVAIWGQHDGNGWGVYGRVQGGGSGGVAVYGRAYGQGTAVRGVAADAGYAGYFNGKIYIDGDLGIGEGDPQYRLELRHDSAAKPTSNTWTISSDRRLKKNINPIADALDKLLALKGVTYQWKRPDTQGGMTGIYTGMIAQDVEKVFPEWIHEDREGFKRLTVIGFEGVVVEAVRELREEKDAQIEALQCENAELRAMLLEMRSELDAIKREHAALN